MEEQHLILRLHPCADAAFCSSAPDTPATCYVNGAFVGGRACGLTAESQVMLYQHRSLSFTAPTVLLII